MANLQGSGPISIGNIKNLFGGPASPSLSNYYRGGSYIPAYKAVPVAVREPTSGWAYSTNPATYWTIQTNQWGHIYWNGVQVAYFQSNSYSSYTVGGITYYRGAKRGSTGVIPIVISLYETFRTYTGSTDVAINTGIPTSGQISLSQFYGAEKP